MLSIFTESKGTFRNIGLFFISVGELVEQLPIPTISAYAGVLKVIGGLFGASGVAKSAILTKLGR